MSGNGWKHLDWSVLTIGWSSTRGVENEHNKNKKNSKLFFEKWNQKCFIYHSIENLTRIKNIYNTWWFGLVFWALTPKNSFFEGYFST
jgi:hypothetical protein